MEATADSAETTSPEDRGGSFVVEEFSRAVLDGVLHDSTGARNRVDVALLPFFEDERPLQGVAGLMDWRGCGRLSRYLRSQVVAGAFGEPLLTVGGRDLPADRLVLVGLGPREAFDEEKAGEVAARLVALVGGLVGHSVLVDMPVGLDREVAERMFGALVEAERARLAEKRRLHDRDEPSEAVLEQAAEQDDVVSAEAPAEADGAPPRPGVEASDPSGPSDPSDPSPVTPSGAKSGTDLDAAEDLDADGVAPDTQPEVASGPGDAVRGAHTGEDGGAERLTPDASPDEPVQAAQSDASPMVEGSNSDPAHETDGRWVAPGWWVIADARLAGRLRRVLSGPPRPATGA